MRGDQPTAAADQDVDAWTASSIAGHVRDGSVTATEVLRRHHRQADLHADVNALVATDWDAAYARAAELDRLPHADRERLALLGVPVTVKDVLCVAGLPATAGSRAWRDNVPTRDAGAVAAVRAAGAVIIGKTNCPEFAFGVTTANQLHGTTKNPRFSSRSPGGSSGGEAVAVAAGISAVGLGTDFGGSLRWPAQCLGITAMRPTPGRVASTGQLPGAGGELGRGDLVIPSPLSMQAVMQVVGPMARSVSDLQLVMAVIGGLDAAPAAGHQPGPPLRIGWSDGRSIAPVRCEVVTALAGAVRLLVESGRNVTEYDQALGGCLAAYNALRDVDPLTDHLLAIRGREDCVQTASLDVLRRSTTSTERDRADAWGGVVAARARALAMFDDIDILLLPVAPGPACELDGSLDVDGEQLQGWDLMGHCRAVTVLGAPVVSLPIATSAEGLPLSAQIIAAPGKDRMALAAADMLARALGGDLAASS